MKRLVALLTVVATVIVGWTQLTASRDGATSAAVDNAAIASAFRDRRSDVQVSGEGTVTRILRDDNEGSRHQRFIVRLGGGQTVLIAHNIDLAPRVTSLAEGDRIAFHGEYEWNATGGVVHWTHRDPDGRHEAGWLRHAGKTFQ